MKNSKISKILNDIANELELKGDNPYRVRAYRRASFSVGKSQENIADLIQKNKDITCIKYVGKAISKQIKEFVLTGKFPQVIIKKRPSDELRHIEGLGPKRIYLIHSKLKIYSKINLLKAIEKKQLEKLPGFGKKLQQKILNNLAKPYHYEVFFKFSFANTLIKFIAKRLLQIKYVDKVTCCGSYRRKKEIVGNVIFVVITSRPKHLIKQFLLFDDVIEVIKEENNFVVVILRSKMQVTLYAVSSSDYGASLLYFTGSSDHIEQLKKISVQKKFILSKKGLFKNNKRICSKTEKEIYSKLGLKFIPPELRENRGEFQASKKNNLPHLVKLKDLKGDLHCHTNATDGTQTLQTMVNAALKKGYDYIAITDHSKRLTITNGLDERRLMQQIELIDELNSQLKGITILKSIEVDILEDGSLDLPNWILKELDLRVCSLHSKFKLSKDKQTERVIRAMDNPYFNILGHPTGRLISHREPYPIDIEKILEAAKQRNCFMELNAQPSRLDLNDIYCLMAKKLGVKIAISSDAHDIKELDFISFGIFQARRGWLEADDVLNTRKLIDLKKLLKR